MKTSLINSGDSFLLNLSIKHRNQKHKKGSIYLRSGSLKQKSVYFNRRFDRLGASPYFRAMVYTVIAVNSFSKILGQVKLFGTSKNLYNVSTRARSTIRKSLLIDRSSKPKKKSQKKWCSLTFRPNSPFFIVWNLLMITFIFYLIIFLPYRLVFSPNTHINVWFEEVMNYLFIIDIFFNFFQGYYNSKGEIILDQKTVIYHYLTSYFILDLLSVIPFKYLINSNANIFLRVLKLPRLIKIFKIFSLMKLEKELIGSKYAYYLRINGGFIQLIILIFMTLLYLHLAAVIWSAIGYNQSDIPFTWIYRYQMEQKSSLEIYFTAFYYCFSVLTTVGYGDIISFTTCKIFQ